MVAHALGVALLATIAVAEASTLDGLRIQVTAVRAAESGPSDPLLVSLRPRLRRLVGYRAFQIVTREERPVSFFRVTASSSCCPRASTTVWSGCRCVC